VTAGNHAPCLNCDAPLAPQQAYCVQCGQKADTHRLSLHDIAHAFIHLLVHVDHSVFALARDLAVRPGRVAREYVQGRRRKYFNPFTFVLVVVGVASLAMAAAGFVNFRGTAPANPVSAFLQRNVNLVILAQLPLLALFAGLLFRAERLNFAEHLVLASYASGFRSIFFMLVVLPLWWFAHTGYQATVAAYIAVWLTYFGVACAQFYAGNRWWNWLKGVLVGLLAQAVTTIAIIGMIQWWFATHRS
jgi:hypothetical protein